MSLSDPLPSNQITRLQFLYKDIHEAITPIFPARHPVLLRMSSPNISSSTSSPLLSAVEDLRGVLVGLRERCAPVRDSLIDDTLRRLADYEAPLPRWIVDATKSVIEIAAVIKDDLSGFIFGTMSEDQLKTVITQQALKSERTIVLSIWGEASLKQSCRDWLNQLVLHDQESSTIDPRDLWKLRLLQSLSSTESITCSLPPSTSPNPTPTSEVTYNALPPPFLFTAPTLFYIQNLLQAIVIAASLRSLIRLPPTLNQLPPSTDFMQRIWTLLKLEIDDELFTSIPEANAEPRTKLVHLADEVVRAHRSASGGKDNLVPPDEEARLRAAVDRTLRTQDPVFLLLQRRLMDAIRAKLLHRTRTGRVNAHAVSGGAPEYLRTGRDVARGGGLHSQVRQGSTPPNDAASKETGLEVKGFEDPVLVASIWEVWGKITHCVDWVESVWADMLVDPGETR